MSVSESSNFAKNERHLQVRLCAAIHDSLPVSLHELVILLVDEPRDQLLPAQELRKLSVRQGGT